MVTERRTIVDPAAAAGAEVEAIRPAGRRLPSAAAVAIALLLPLALALSLLSAQGEPFGWDAPVAVWVQAAPAWTVGLATALSWVGLFAPSLVLALALAAWLWRIGARGPAAVVVVASLLHGINLPMKAAIGRARPPTDVVEVIELASGLGFPSGHALGAMVLFPVMAVSLGLVVRPGWTLRVVQAVVFLLAVGIGWSRVRLGAHWPSDVLGGWLWGAAIALMLLAWRPRWRRAAVGASGARDRGQPD